MSAIAANMARIRSALPAGVTLLAVSKFHPIETLQEAYDAGQRVFGENRVQELIVKQLLLPQDIEWHFIGTLQTNKIKFIAHFIHTIQSIDSIALLQEVNRQAAGRNRRIRVLLEIHIAREPSKYGFTPDECRAFFRDGWPETFPNVCIGGLMGMATFTDDVEQVRSEFRSLRTLFDELKPLAGDSFDTLSMGMSGDFPVAVQEGSTLIRIGSSIFGERRT
jgi:pyridoxal phosphate enzyme (YggS family)